MSATQFGEDYIPSLINDIQSLDHEGAVHRLLSAVSEYPGDPRPLVLLAGEYAQSRAYDLAEAAFISALQRAPDYAIARFQLGLLQFTSGRPAAASATWDALSSLPEGHAFRLLKTGFEYLSVDNFSEASRLIQLGMQANTTNPPLNKDMQMILNAMPKTPQQGSAQPHPHINFVKETADEEVVNEEATEHFLMSAYRNLH